MPSFNFNYLSILRKLIAEIPEIEVKIDPIIRQTEDWLHRAPLTRDRFKITPDILESWKQIPVQEDFLHLNERETARADFSRLNENNLFQNLIDSFFDKSTLFRLLHDSQFHLPIIPQDTFDLSHLPQDSAIDRRITAAVARFLREQHPHLSFSSRVGRYLVLTLFARTYLNFIIKHFPESLVAPRAGFPMVNESPVNWVLRPSTVDPRAPPASGGYPGNCGLLCKTTSSINDLGKLPTRGLEVLNQYQKQSFKINPILLASLDKTIEEEGFFNFFDCRRAVNKICVHKFAKYYTAYRLAHYFVEHDLRFCSPIILDYRGRLYEQSVKFGPQNVKFLRGLVYMPRAPSLLKRYNRREIALYLAQIAFTKVYWHGKPYAEFLRIGEDILSQMATTDSFSTFYRNFIVVRTNKKIGLNQSLNVKWKLRNAFSLLKEGRLGELPLEIDMSRSYCQVLAAILNDSYCRRVTGLAECEENAIYRNINVDSWQRFVEELKDNTLAHELKYSPSDLLVWVTTKKRKDTLLSAFKGLRMRHFFGSPLFFNIETALKSLSVKKREEREKYRDIFRIFLNAVDRDITLKYRTWVEENFLEPDEKRGKVMMFKRFHKVGQLQYKINYEAFNKRRIEPTVTTGGKKTSIYVRDSKVRVGKANKQFQGGLLPNLIHNLDARLLMDVISHFQIRKKSIITIHDAFVVTRQDARELRKAYLAALNRLAKDYNSDFKIKYRKYLIFTFAN